MTWRSDIRTPGLPPDVRRLGNVGNVRLECRVGMKAGLISNSSNIIGRLTQAVPDTPAYCDRKAPLYLFFADRPSFSVALRSGNRREVLSIDKLYGSASDDPGLKNDLPHCDCDVLVDCTYVLPLGDAIVTSKTSRAEVIAALETATVINFDSGFEVWVYRTGSRAPAEAKAECVILFPPGGIVKKTGLRPAHAARS
jgi:hypothetical protein